MNPLKMYFSLKIGIFSCYVSLPEGVPGSLPIVNAIPQAKTAMDASTKSFDSWDRCFTGEAGCPGKVRINGW